MKLLVVGGSGQLGGALVACNGQFGIEVTHTGRPQLDLTVPGSIKSVICSVAPDVVVNAAAYTAVDSAQSESHAAFATNAVGAGNLASVCAKADIPIIHISTDYVFDGRKATPYDESDGVQPLGVYGASKLEGERLVASACRKHIILRTAWLFSPRGKNFAKTMLRLAEDNRSVKVVNDQIGSPTYVPHLAVAIVCVAKHILKKNDNQRWGIYHAAGSGETSWAGLATEIFRISEELGGPMAEVIPIPTSEYPTPTDRPCNSRLACHRLEANFNIRLPHWQDGVSACVHEILESNTEGTQ